MASQTINGKAFEYSLLIEFYEKLKILTRVRIHENKSFEIAKSYFINFSRNEQSNFRISASAAINFLIDIEPRLTNAINEKDELVLEIVSDKEGQSGDVRDVLTIRSEQKWEIGISAKNNHKAVKHCTKWTTIVNMHDAVYVPILEAFKKELIKLDKNNPSTVAQNLVQYLIGTKDFYKVIKGKRKVEIQAYNIHGTLNQSFQKTKPKAKLQKLKLPSRLIEVVFKKDSKTTLIVSLDEGWQISFRIHNASSRVEPSLKFDINLISAPQSLFTQHVFVNM